MKRSRTHTLNIFTRILLGLFAVFYISIFIIEATHSHNNLVEVANMTGDPDSGSGAEDTNSSPDRSTNADTIHCDICAYFAYHDNHKGLAVNAIPSIVPLVRELVSLNEFGLTRPYQAVLKNFVNRGPPRDPA